MGLNRYPLWKNGLIVVAILLGLLYALPNIYGEDPAIQISPLAGQAVTESTHDVVRRVLEANQHNHKSIESLENGGLVVRLSSQEKQLEIKSQLEEKLGNGFIIALNLAPATPAWLRAIGGDPMKLGLDLRGGVHFLMEVDVDAVIAQREKAFINELKSELRKSRIRYSRIRESKPRGLVIHFREGAERQKAERFLSKNFPEFAQLEEADKSNPALLRLKLTDAEVKNIQSYAVAQSITTLNNRINELGVAEPIIQAQGSNRIIVQLPGVQDTARAKEIIGKTATLEFLLVDEEADVSAAERGLPKPGTRLIRDERGYPHVFKNQVILSGENIVGAQSDYDEMGKPSVAIRVGGATGYFSKVTRENKGRAMGTIYKETRFEDRVINGQKVRVKVPIEKAISVATIRSALGNRFQITGVGNAEEARNLALLLRAGALPAPIDIVEERTIGPSLGQENIRTGMNSILGGLSMVLVFMAVYYRTFGLIANIGLLANLLLLVAILSGVGATLTLPGIAGIVLTLGMAVDANVLIFERIREEIRNGVAPQSCIHGGFEKAFATIMDANITTFIAALVLFTIGSGPIKGFAVTLTIGLITSVFTAVMVSRALINLIYGRQKIQKLNIGI